mmetsp:Transcript_1882/g.2872  ORF Transcript_1882/g.2872 Transcript_1882/m.2872 type:complete len:284 (-) Transcript_1882:49-900(-)|eukprot:CAMPEP_0201511024 /NCGR_PEP_ID=MMETSP0161_2-20130828/3545_1 /ASSEMBLY_ACC=CAM_ASM_000251 /TAXON_ID=180227 /ORGANISM="Neoparamoeba aestuarina, Strain SoJaBio B1-5/56/2" /LENGTH=283 /DNA_ID=CAMNT_0047906351 /DNA_START=44 /DNA_END=895 /DNA_ORIENTATION=+
MSEGKQLGSRGYLTSSQRRDWVFERDQLAKMREDAIGQISESKRRNAISAEEYCTYRLFSEQKIIEVCERLNYPTETVTATAVVFLKRYFLYPHGPDISTMMITCIFLACKVEEHHVDLSQILKDMSSFLDTSTVDERNILNSEIILMKSLKFHLQVYHPFRSLDGFCDELQKHLPSADVEALKERAHSLLKNSLTSDLCFLTHPPLIALGALRCCAEGGVEGKVGGVIEKVIVAKVGGNNEQTIQKQAPTLQMIDRELRRESDENYEIIGDVQRKLEQKDGE